MRFDHLRFALAVDQRRRAEGLSRRELARQLDISPSTFTRLAQGNRPDVETFVKLLDWLDQPAEAYFAARPGESPLEHLGTVRQIAEALHRDPSLSPDQATALEDIVRVAYHRLRDG